MTRVRLLGLMTAVLALVAGCADTPESATAASSTPTVPSAPAAKRVIPEQLRFTAKTVDDGEFSGESLPAMPVVLWFWAPWCPYCNQVAPTVAKVAAANAGNVAFVGVSGEDTRSAMKDFVRKYRLDIFPQLADLDGGLFRQFRVIGKPTFVFVDTDGTVTRELGAVSEERLTELVRGLGKKAPRTEVATTTPAEPIPA